MIRAASIVSIALLVACSRGEAPQTAAGGAAVTQLLAHLPPDTEVVVSGSLAELASWPLWRRAVGVIAYDAPEVAARIGTRCGLDPWTVLDDAALAIPADPESAVVAVETTFDRARIHECLGKVGDGSSAIAIDPGPVTRYRQTESIEVAAWLTDRIALAIPLRMDEEAALQSLVPPRAVPEALQALLGRVDRGATIWAIAQVKRDGLGEMLAMMPLPAQPIGVHAAIRRKSSMTGYAALVFGNANDAREAAKVLQTALDNPPPPLVPWRDALHIETRDDEVRVVLTLDVERAKQLDAAIAGLLPEPRERPAKR